MNDGIRQEFSIDQGVWSTTMIVSFLSDLNGGRAHNNEGYLEIISDEEIPGKSFITIDAPSLADAAVPLSLPKGTVKGYGRGTIAWSRNPDFELVTDEETKQELAQAMLILLLTAKGELPMVRSYGVGLRELVFQPINPRLLSVIRHRIAKETLRWDPRVFPERIDVVGSDNRLFLDVGFAAKDQQITGQVPIPLKGPE